MKFICDLFFQCHSVFCGGSFQIHDHIPVSYTHLIAGFDDINYAHLTVPKLTTIHQNMERQAELAVPELLSAIQNPIYMGKEVLLDVMLIARDSI